jgi:hypothetical protein
MILIGSVGARRAVPAQEGFPEPGKAKHLYATAATVYRDVDLPGGRL